MNAAKLLASTAAAVTLAGAIGFAYAQSNSTDSTRSTTNPQTGSQTTTPSSSDQTMRNQSQNRSNDGTGSTSSGNPNRSSDGTGNMSSSSRDMSGERMARGDRN